MRLIVGLGNPGSEYIQTRHNAGAMMVEQMIVGQNMALDKKFEGLVFKDGELVYLYPQTFMNESGRSVRKMMDYFHLEIDSLILIHDDLDLPLGEYKIQKGVGPKIHNGVNSVESCVGKKDFWRVRLGVDNRKETGYNGSGADYVLTKFRKEEIQVLNEVIKSADEELQRLELI